MQPKLSLKIFKPRQTFPLQKTFMFLEVNIRVRKQGLDPIAIGF